MRGRHLAERCFALARSTTFPGEREAAIARGIAIANKAGISLDRFDIPGRARASTPPPPPRPKPAASKRKAEPTSFRSPFMSGKYSSADLNEAMARFRQTMDETAAATGAGPDETIYAAKRRNFDAAVAAAAQRDAMKAQAARWPTPRFAADFLFSRGVPVYDLGSGDRRWFAPNVRQEPMTDCELRGVADSVAQ